MANPPPLRKSRRLSWLLDQSIPLPGGYRIGLDGLLGLIPGVGDAIGGALSTWVVYQAVKLGAPKSVIIRMLINIGIDSTLGAIPVLGDIFDFLWKSNVRNMKLLEDFEAQPRETRNRSLISDILIIGAALLIIIGLIYALVSLVQWALR